MINPACCPSRIIRCLLCLLLLTPSHVLASLTLTGGSTTTLHNSTLTENISLETGIETINTDGTVNTLSGVISGPGELDETGGGTLTLSGANTYTGGTTVEGGSTLSISSASNLGSTSGSLTLNSGTLETTAGVTLSENVTLGSGGGTIKTDGVHDTLSGVISGSGGLTETGGGTLTLSGDNTYTGPTVVESGTLQAGVAVDAFGSNSAVTLDNTAATLDLNDHNETIGSLSGGGTTGGNVTLGSGNLTVGGDNTSTDFAGVISGTGELIKTGTGVLELSGTNTYTGGTEIADGTLELGVNNALKPTGNVTVDASGTLDDDSHNETLAVLTNNGTTKIGSGVLSVASYSGSGTLSLNLRSPGNLNATGTAALAGTSLTLNFGSSYLPTGQAITIVTAGSVTGQLVSVSQTASLSVTPSYTSTGVSLSIGEIPYLHTAGNSNQTQIATALDQVRDSATGDLATVTGALNVLNVDQLRSAFNQMSPDALQPLSQLGTLSENAQFSSLTQRFDAIGRGATHMASGHFQYYDAQAQKSKSVEAILAYGGPDVSGLGVRPAASNPWGYFVSGVGSFGKLDAASSSSGAVPGYKFTTSGATFGADYRLNDSVTVGGAAGYIESHVLSDQNASTIDGQSFKFGVYGVGHQDRWLANGYVGGAGDLYKTNRNITVGALSRSAGASPKGEEFNTRWGLAYDYKARIATFRPTAAIEYDRAMIHSFDESGAGALNLNVGSQTDESLRTEFGGRMTREYKVADKIWTPYVSAAWQHEYKSQGSALNAQFSSGGSAFTTQTADAGRDTALLGAGTVFQWTSAVSLFFNYIGEVGRTNFIAHNFDGGLRYRF